MDAPDLPTPALHGPPAESGDANAGYYPLVDTLRLYAGWLLAFLVVLSSASGFALLGKLPFHSQLLQEWLLSGAIRNAAFVTFLFLLLSTVHGVLRGGVWKGIGLMLVGFVVFVSFMMYA